MYNFSKILVPVIALSLTACGGSTTNTSELPKGHTVVIGANIPGGPALKGSGNLTTTKRTVEQFHAIELKDCCKVQVTIGMPLEMQVTTDDNLTDAIDTKVTAGVLTIGVNKDFQSEHSPNVMVAVPECSEITINGSGDVAVNAVKGDVFNVTVPGSGSCSAAGKVTNEKITISGSGSVDCSKVTADNVTVDLSGSGSCKVDSEKSLTAKLNGSGAIQYKGSPQSLNKDVTGSGSITAMAN